MTLERYGVIQFAGEDQTIVGPDLEVGQIAPAFVAIDQDWAERNPLKETSGKVRIIASVVSLDTSVCDRETKQFNEQATSLGDDGNIFVISADLPFTQKRWCGANGIDQVEALSDHMHSDFGSKYGCLIKEKRILRRATFVIDREGKVGYVEYLPELVQEPDYAAVLKAARSLL
jgi:thiol peroxidase